MCDTAWNMYCFIALQEQIDAFKEAYIFRHMVEREVEENSYPFYEVVWQLWYYHIKSTPHPGMLHLTLKHKPSLPMPVPFWPVDSQMQ